jgi:branched-chain amino acid transport system ATP-binding protein
MSLVSQEQSEHGAGARAPTFAAREVTKDFGGLRAVDSVSLELERGEILGLIGPNGSGKTTFINVVTGRLPITAGEVWVDGTNITGWPAHKIAQLHLIRTFQLMKPFKRLTVLENVEVAAVSVEHLSRRKAQVRARAILERMGLAERAGLLAGVLPTGEERNLEVARALAAGPAFLLLDEPAAGLNDQESEQLVKSLAGIPSDMDCGLLVVDHDMRFIMGLCDRIHVLNHGRTICRGTCEEVQRDPEVIAAYLGSAAEEDFQHVDR